MYLVINNPKDEEILCVKRLQDSAFIPLDSANRDYQQFKQDLAAGAELQDADGNTMTPEQVQEFLTTLP